MLASSKKCNRQLAFELQNSYVCEKRSNTERTKPCRRFIVSYHFFVTTSYAPVVSIAIALVSESK